MDSIFNTPNLLLRPIEPNDIDHIYTWENNTTLWQVGQSSLPFSRHILEQYINTVNDDIFEAKQLRLIIETKEEKQIIGAVDLFDFDPLHQRAGVGILIYPEEKKHKGYATEALKAIEEYAFFFLGIHQLYATVTEDNVASIHLFQKAGYQLTSTKKEWIKRGNQWLDQHIFQLITPLSSL